MSKEVVLTGLRTNGEYHLGNYIGALMPMVRFATEKADEYQVHLFAPDLHSFITPVEFGQAFRDQIVANLKLFVASGIPLDSDSVFIYRQSYVPAHSELTWILNNFTGHGEMARMTEYKDKAAKLDGDRINLALFDYPVLQAADVLLYDAKWVPVGEDQRQHLEFTREIAQRLNNQFDDLFVVPETLEKQQAFVGRTEAPRIRSLRNPEKKMSKSVSDPAGTILLTDAPDDARKKIMSAETDSVGSVNFDWENQPGVTNLLTILSALSGRSQDETNAEWTGNDRYGDLKKAVADVVATFLEDLQAKMNDVTNEDLEQHLARSEEKMNEIANAKLYKVQEAIGLR